MRRFLLTLSIIVYLFPLSIKAEAIGSSTPAITTGAVTGNISACFGSPAASPNIQQFTVSGSNLTGVITAKAPTGFEVSLSKGSGYVDSLTLTPSGGKVTDTVLYVRSAGSDSPGSISGNVTVSSSGLSQTVAVSATINALPTVAGEANQTVNTGGTTTPVNFTGTANTITWVNGTPSIGLAPSGMGNTIAAFTAINKGTTPIIDTITVTPIHSALAYIANLVDSTVSVINTGTNAVLSKIKVGAYPIGVAVSADGSTAYVTNAVSHTVSVINTTSNTVVATIPVGSYPQGIAVSPNDSLVYVVEDGVDSVSVINTATEKGIAAIKVGSKPYGITVSPDGSRVYVVNTGDGTVSVINTKTNAVMPPPIAVGLNPVCVAESPDGSLVYVTNQYSQSVSVINTTNNTVVSNILVGKQPTGITLSPDGSLLYVANSDTSSNTVSVIKTSTNSVLTTIPVGMVPYGVSVNPQGTLLFVANEGSKNVSVINTATNKVIDTITVGNKPYAFGNFITSDVSCSGPPVTFTITVTVPTIVAGKVTGNISACVGTASASPDIEQFIVSGTNLKGDITAKATAGFEVSLSRGSGYADSLTLTQSGGTVTDTVYVRSAASDPVGSISGTVTLTSFEAGTQTVAVSGTINALVIPSVTIKASADTICSGTAVTITAKSANGGSAPIYQWLVNGSKKGTDSAIFSSSTLANGDTITCRLTSNATCATPADTISNSIIMNVTPSAIPSVTITASKNNICAGTPVTFTATPINGGSTPVYKWMVNGVAATSDSATFSSSTLANGDTITCRLTSNATCATPANATSNSIIMIVNPQLTPSVRITAPANTICTGAMVTFTAAATNGGSAPVYQWMRNGANVGTHSSSYSSDSLANGDTITCQLTSNAACVTPATATSNSIAMIVNPYVSPSVSIAASSNPICAGTAVTFTATPGYGGSAPVYQWLINNNRIAGADSATFSSSTIVSGDVISCTMTSNSTCVTPASATSNSITMNVTPPVSPSVSIAASANPICAGTAVTFTATAINGGGTAPVYRWQLNGADEGTSGATYSSSTLANGDVISCIMTSNAACAIPANATSNSIPMIVNPLPVVNAGGDKTIDGGGSVLLNATATGNVANITWLPATGLNNNKILNPVANPSSTTTYTIVVQTADGCLGTDSMTVKVLMPEITIPNTFTPNSDGINDRWDIKNLDAYPECTVMIYNRWGENVYSSIGYGVPWDGTYHGAALPVGVYYYIINRRDGLKVMSGYVTIIR